MTQTRYTLQQHHVNLKSSVKLSHVNMCIIANPLLQTSFRGIRIQKLSLFKRDRDNFISAINFYRFEKMIYYW